MSELDTQLQPPAETTGTEYVVLEHDEDTHTWIEVARRYAPSPKEAIRGCIGTGVSGITQSTYVAVPARSWKPVIVKAEQTVTLKLEAAE